MKFDNLYRLVVNSKTLNEADEKEDALELANDVDPVDSSIETDFETDFGTDELATEPTTEVDPMSLSPEEKVQYLIKNSKIINRNPNWTENDKRAKAEYIVKNDLFDAFVEPIETRLAAQEPNEVLPTELDTDMADTEDIEDIKSGLESERELRRRENEDFEEGLPD